MSILDFFIPKPLYVKDTILKIKPEFFCTRETRFDMRELGWIDFHFAYIKLLEDVYDIDKLSIGSAFRESSHCKKIIGIDVYKNKLNVHGKIAEKYKTIKDEYIKLIDQKQIDLVNCLIEKYEINEIVEKEREFHNLIDKNSKLMNEAIKNSRC